MEASQAATKGIRLYDDYPGGACAPPGCSHYHFGLFLYFIVSTTLVDGRRFG